MKSEKLDRKITLQRYTSTENDLGETVEDWTTLATRRAQYFAVDGDERFGGEQWVAKEQVEFRVRWDTLVATLSPLDRVIYPASGSPTPANTYDIMAVIELGRHVGLRIMAARRSDARPV